MLVCSLWNSPQFPQVLMKELLIPQTSRGSVNNISLKHFVLVAAECFLCAFSSRWWQNEALEVLFSKLGLTATVV